MRHLKQSFCLFILLLSLHSVSSLAQSNPAAQVTSDDVRALRELLVQQQQQLESLKKEVESLRTEAARRDEILNPPTATPTSAALTGSPVIPPTPDKPESPRPPSAFRFNGLLQVWGIAGDAGYHDTFRIRRTELKFSGDMSPHVHWLVMVDPSKALSINATNATVGGTSVVSTASVNQASRILQDAAVSIDKVPHLRVDVGQFKIPLSLEGSESSATLPTPERALFMSDRARGGAYGDIRDVGVMLTSTIGKRMTLIVGEFNGVGDRQNDLALNDQKATIGRAFVKPLPWLHFGVSGAYGNGNVAAGRPRHDRIGAEFMVSQRGFRLKSEWMQGEDSNTTRQGYYAVASYRPPTGRFASFEPVLRFDTFDPDISHSSMTAATVPERDYITGLNWYLESSRVRLQFNYTRKTYTRDIVPARNMLFVTMQTAW